MSFSDEWNEALFGKSFDFKQTNSFSRDALTYDGGEVKNIHYGDIHTKFQTMFDITQEDVPFLNDNVDLSKIKKDNYCEEGDLVIADASEDYADVGKSIELKNLNGQKLVAGLHTYIARPRKGIFTKGFSGYLMQSWTLRKQIMMLANGSKVLGISTGNLKQVIFKIPTLPEQQKIAGFLSAVDEKLKHLNRKKELLQQYKKGVMQQLFAQELRFKREDGMDYPDWEWMDGDKLFDNISDKNHNSDLPILAITQDQGAVPRDLIDYKMTVTDKSIASYKVVQVGDFVISLRTFQGGIEYSNYKGICSPAYIILRPSSDSVDRVFYKFYLKTDYYIAQLQKNLEGIRDGKMISYKYFSEIKLPVPSIEEQQKIASFLSSLDRKIDAVSAQIELTQQFKKGLLQEMFV